ICEHSTYAIFAPKDVVMRDFRIFSKEDLEVYHRNPEKATRLTTGIPFARGYVDNGDFVLVNKLAYNFSSPQRGDVFVFRTTGISGIEDRPDFPNDLGSQHYIKRLAGLPGDTLRIISPELFSNGQRASAKGFQRVMSLKDGYRGYSNPSMGAIYLTDTQETVTVPQHCFFALGDNSYNSSDSRYWGFVPQANVTGKAFVAFWPFTSHWGFID
ncbi:MAG TPA: signal peptidase I, partial [Chthoniobacterales bacterium]|nr:signal peptidase I [Chthoniobacterales bacterium]